MPDVYYNYMPINDGYNSNFFYKIESPVPASQRPTTPLVMWLQGGPGSSSLFGAYALVGAKLFRADAKSSNGYSFEGSNFTWTKHVTMLYVDNPIGTGFSFTDDPKGFSTTGRSRRVHAIVWRLPLRIGANYRKAKGNI